MQKTEKKMSPDDYMRLAIVMAQKVPRYPFGAVIVRRTTGEVLAKGYNRSSRNPLVHGEIDVINRCAAKHAPVDWTALDLYTTAEPCPMCQSAIEWAGIATVYFGTSIPFLQQHGWRQIDIRAEEVARRTPFQNTQVIGGILEQECNALFEAAQGDAMKE
jgi:tRNA(adenine34) deaminase